MTDIIERVARAIEPTPFQPLAGHEQGKCPECDQRRYEARRQARAAISAMGDPVGFRWNEGWRLWEQVVPEAIESEGVFKAYGLPAPPETAASPSPNPSNSDE